MKEFLKKPIVPNDPSKRVVLIFHCEFSSERGPKLSRFLRSQDRQMNKDCYPSLHYPELYLLDGGYKVYFETEKVSICTPVEQMIGVGGGYCFLFVCLCVLVNFNPARNCLPCEQIPVLRVH